MCGKAAGVGQMDLNESSRNRPVVVFDPVALWRIQRGADKWKGHLPGGGLCKLTVDDPPHLLETKLGLTLTAAPLAFVSSKAASIAGSGSAGLPRVRMMLLGLLPVTLALENRRLKVLARSVVKGCALFGFWFTSGVPRNIMTGTAYLRLDT